MTEMYFKKWKHSWKTSRSFVRPWRYDDVTKKKKKSARRECPLWKPEEAERGSTSVCMDYRCMHDSSTGCQLLRHCRQVAYNESNEPNEGKRKTLTTLYHYIFKTWNRKKGDRVGKTVICLFTQSEKKNTKWRDEQIDAASSSATTQRMRWVSKLGNRHESVAPRHSNREVHCVSASLTF